MFVKIAAIAVAALVVVSASRVATAKTADPPFATGVSTTGGTIGPDGALYAGVSGNGNTEVVLPPDIAEAFGIQKAYFGLNSTVMRVDPSTGAVTTFATGLPSASETPGGEPAGPGPADVVFMNGTLYALITGSANYVGGAAANYPNGVYKYNSTNKTWTVIANLSKFNDDHPVTFPDAGPGGNPFSISVRGQEFIVSDGNYNRLLRVALDGTVTILSTFDNIVPTGTDAPANGPVYNTWFSPFPHSPGSSKLQQIGYPTGTVTELASGTQLIDVHVGANGKIYVLSMGDPSAEGEQSGLPSVPGTGQLMVLEGNQLKTLVDGLNNPTSFSLAGDTAYITSLVGDVTKVTGVSTLTPVAATPTAQPTTAPAPTPTPGSGSGGAITAPNTGTGGAQPASASPERALALTLIVGGCLVLAGLGMAVTRRTQAR